MGYSTDFFGGFAVTPTLRPEHQAYLTAFAQTRRMKRDAAKVALLPDAVREAAGLPVGIDGGNYVGAGPENFGQERTDDVVDYNQPPSGQPGLWCQWVPNSDGTAIEWDLSEKFYSYVEWITYLTEKFLKPWGYTLNGQVEWQGEDPSDMGAIVIRDNTIKVGHAEVRYVFD